MEKKTYIFDGDDDDVEMQFPNPHLRNIPPNLFYRESQPLCCLFGPKFCLSFPKTFHIREKLRMNRDDCFKVYDSDGVECFKVSNPLKTMRGKHVISNVDGEELVKLKKKLLAIHPTWHINSGHNLESRLATLVFEFTLLKKKCHVYVYDTPYPHEDDNTDYEHLRPRLLIKSDTTGRDFKVYDEATNDVYAETSKRHIGTTELLMEKDDYKVTVTPGVDVLFMVALTLMYEYALSDIEN